MRKNVSSVWPTTNDADFTAIILAAGEADFIKTFGSNRSLVTFRDTTLIAHQISTLRSKYTKLSDIIVVLGFDWERTIKSIPFGVRVILNERWAETSETHSLDLALKATTSNSVIIVSGDIYFESESLILPTRSTLTTAPMKSEKVGMSLNEGKVSHLSYGLPDKWAQISYVVGLDQLRKIVTDDKALLFEVLNTMIEGGAEFDCVVAEGIKEINSYRDAEGLL